MEDNKIVLQIEMALCQLLRKSLPSVLAKYSRYEWFASMVVCLVSFYECGELSLMGVSPDEAAVSPPLCQFHMYTGLYLL